MRRARILTLLAVLAASSTVRADARPCVSVSSPDEPLSPGLLASFDELVARAQLRRVDVRDLPASCARTLRLRLMASPYAVTIHAESLPPDGREVERRLPRDAEAMVFEETLAHALYGALSPWLSEEPLGRVVLGVLAALGASWLGAPSFDAQGWLGLSVAARTRLAPELSLRGGFSGAPTGHARDAVRHHTGKLRLYGGLVVLERRRFRVRAALGLGVDLIAARAGRLGRDARASRTLEPVGMLGALGGLDVRLARRLALGVELGVDLALRRLRYVVVEDGRDSTWLSTPRAQPFAQLTLHAEPFAFLTARSRP